MKKALKIIISVICILLAILFAGFLYFRTTPEYTLVKIYQGYKNDGIDGIYPHLTHSAEEKLELIRTIAQNKLIGSIVDMFSGDEDGFFSEIINNPDGIKWSYEGTQKDETNANITLSFDIDGKMSGRFDIVLIKADGEWKLDSFDNPVFDKFSL